MIKNNNSIKLKINVENNSDSAEERADWTNRTNQFDKTDWTDKTDETDKKQNSVFVKISRACLYLLIFLTPLFFLPYTIAPVEINKQFLAAVLLFVAFTSYLIDSLENKRIVYPQSLLTLSVIILLAAAGISAVFSKNFLVSLWGNFVQPDSLINFALYGLAFYLGAVVFTDRTDRSYRTIGLVFLIGLALTVVFGLLQILGKFVLPWGFVHQTDFNTVGGLLNWGIFIAFGLVIIAADWTNRTKWTNKTNRSYWTYLLILLVLSILAALIILNNQFLWLSLALTMIVMAAYKFAIKARLGLPLIIMMVALFFFLISQSLPVLMSLPTEIRPTFTSTFQVAKETISGKRILFGSGPATFGYDWSLFRPTEINQTNIWSIRFNQGFSFLSTSLATFGVFGILAIFFLIFCFVRTFFAADRIDRTYQTDRTYITAIFGGAAFLMINWFLHPPFFTQMIFIFLGLGLIAAFVFPLKEISLDNLPRKKSFFFFSALIIFLVLSLALFSLISQKYMAALDYRKGIQSSQEGDLSQSLIHLDKAAKLDPGNDQYQRTFSQALLLRARELIQQNPNINLQNEGGLQLINILAIAIQTADAAAKINPADSFNWSNLGNIYENLIPLAKGADDLAIQSYRKAMATDPKNPQEPVNLARVLLASAQRIQNIDNQQEVWENKIQETKQALDKSINLLPNYQPAISLINQINQMGY